MTAFERVSLTLSGFFWVGYDKMTFLSVSRTCTGLTIFKDSEGDVFHVSLLGIYFFFTLLTKQLFQHLDSSHQFNDSISRRLVEMVSRIVDQVEYSLTYGMGDEVMCGRHILNITGCFDPTDGIEVPVYLYYLFDLNRKQLKKVWSHSTCVEWRW